MNLPRRKTVRLQRYDYSTPGTYFVTICTHDRKCFLSDVSEGAIHESPGTRLTDAGRCVQNAIGTLPARFPNLTLDKYVIMPNHIHLLLSIADERAIHESPLRQERKRSLLGQIVGYLKMNSSKQIHSFAPELQVWQRSYYEHVIRGEEDYREIWEYIDSNPAKWAEDRYYV